MSYTIDQDGTIHRKPTYKPQPSSYNTQPPSNNYDSNFGCSFWPWIIGIALIIISATVGKNCSGNKSSNNNPACMDCDTVTGDTVYPDAGVSDDYSMVDTTTTTIPPPSTYSSEPQVEDVSANFENFSINADEDNYYLIADFNVNGMRGVTGEVICYFEPQYTEGVPKSKYVYKPFTPNYDNAKFSNFSITVSRLDIQSMSQFEFQDDHLKMTAVVKDDKGNTLAESRPIYITVN